MNEPAQPVERFPAIEGLRGYLALAVMASHVFQLAGLHPVRPWIPKVGTAAVLAFIIVSGFVITHLVLTRRESYPAYIVRRFWRLFPVYFVTTVIGGVTIALYAKTFPWAPEILEQLQQTQTDYFWQHVVAHVLMIHGAISNDVLPLSQYAFLGPAWSISLEWQFYLIAPFIVCARRKTLLIALVLLCGWLYTRGYFGSFHNASLIAGAGVYFMIGIWTRLVMANLRVTAPLAIVLAIACTLPFTDYLAPLAIWAVAIGTICSRPSEYHEQTFIRTMRWTLENRIALWLGKRSYSVYLVHYPLLILADRLLFDLSPQMSRPAYVVALAAIAVPAVLVSSWLLYRWFEQPGIALGHRLAAERPILKEA